ncbi:MAG: tetratricopeptide repeat protein [Gammaproteobacteria bacterium]|jgi:tetratricopeptide (TPR) repeat protein
MGGGVTSGSDIGSLIAEGNRLLQTGEPAAAAEQFNRVLSTEPENAEAWVGLGRARNNLRDFPAAEQAFRHAARLWPESADVQNMLGHVLRALEDTASAGEAFRRALALDPDHAAAHRNLGTILMLDEKPADAAESFRRALALNPDDRVAGLDLGIVLHTMGRFAEAVTAYRRLIERHPDDPLAYLYLGIVHDEMRQTEPAEMAFERARELAPDMPEVYAELANLYEETNRLDRVTEMVGKGLALAPDHPQLNLEAAKSERRAGRVEAAIARLEAFDYPAFDHRLRQQFHFELGRMHDQAGNAEAAFQHFSEGNRLASRNWRINTVQPHAFVEQLERILDHISLGPGADQPIVEFPDSESPVFLVGFPRSGTTLTDVILDSHPALQTLEELPTLSAVREEMDALGKPFPEALELLNENDLRRLRARYFSEVGRYVDRLPGTRLVDKLPIRTMEVELIWRLFPSAKIVLSIRHPCDVCLSNFMQNYMLNNAFANFFTLGDSIGIYDRVMRIWQKAVERLPLHYHVMKYENLVDDFNGEVAAMLAFLGLPWDEAVTRYTERVSQRGRINTNSYHQVAEPIYRRARYRWRRYGRQFEPFMATLRPHIDYFGYTDAD